MTAMAADGSDELLYEVDGAVATATVNRPEKRNSLSPAVIGGLRRAVAAAAADPDVRVLVLTGAGDRAFSAGADLAGGDGGFLGGHESRGDMARLFEELWALGKPTIAKVRGYALAGGFGLALACDLVVASDDAQFGTPEMNVGLWPYMITVPMVRSMPPKKALELMMTARRVDAREALDIGFVNRVVPAAELDRAVAELAATLADRSPLVMALGRDSFYTVWDQAAGPALRHLHAMLTITSQTEDAREGLAAFAEKRAPRWTGR